MKLVKMLQEKFDSISAEDAFYYVERHGPSPKLENIIATSALYSYHYAHDVLKDKSPAGEKAIASDAQYSYDYANYVLESRFLKGEKAILTDPYFASQYAMEVMCRRWLKAEPIIRNSWHWDDYKEYFNII